MRALIALPPLLLAACGGGGGAVNYQTDCTFETGVQGSYSSTVVSGSAGLVTPVYAAGGTDAGAATLNACIRQRAAADGVPVAG